MKTQYARVIGVDIASLKIDINDSAPKTGARGARVAQPNVLVKDVSFHRFLSDQPDGRG